MKINRRRNTKAATTRATHTPPIRLRGTFPQGPGPRPSGQPEPPPGLVCVASGPGGSGRFCVAAITTAASHRLDNSLVDQSLEWGTLRTDVVVNGVWGVGDGPVRQLFVGQARRVRDQRGRVVAPVTGPCEARIPTGDRCTSPGDRKSTRLNSSHITISYAVFCLKKKKKKKKN